MDFVERMQLAGALMRDFAARTGLQSPATPHRYLWTDAFAVCNYLELHRQSGAAEPLQLATTLAEQVHVVLGRHRGDDGRSGWLSGLPEAEGRAHPTRGGLRIGKPLRERGPGEPLDRELEWDRDGQYFHYLTRWMHALARLAHARGEPQWLRLAVELAQAAHAKFVRVQPGTGRKVLHWKMSIDLSRPLVPTTGHHDPLDGLIALLELRADCAMGGEGAMLPRLEGAIADLRALHGNSDCATDDPLGLGGLLCGAWTLAQLKSRGQADEEELLSDQLKGAATGLRVLVASAQLRVPPARRLPFRELGLAIGLHAVERLAALPPPAPRWRQAIQPQLADLLRFTPIAERIAECWLDPGNQALVVWQEHLDINSVMLATALLPDGHLAVGGSGVGAGA